MGSPLPQLITINDQNNILTVVQNGRRSDPLELRKDRYSPGSLAKAIQNKINDDKVLGKRGIQVRDVDGRLEITAGSYGSRSKIEVEPGKDKELSALGLVEGKSVKGKDVEGKIDGIEARGRGQLLIGAEETPSEGLRIYVSLDEIDLLPDEEEARVKLTKGVAVKLGEILKRVNDPVKGDVTKVTGDISDQIGSYDEQIGRLNERMDDKQKSLQLKFAKLDNTMGRLRSQQSYINQQLAALGSKPGQGGAK